VRNIKSLILLVLAMNGFYSQVFATDLVLTAPPREKPAAGQKIYGPIAAHLSKSLGVNVVYKHPENWLKYQREMRNDKYDIVFDGPHFIAWRIAHLGHEALVKLPGKLQFMLVNKVDNKKLDHPDKLIGKKICGISPPNLSTLSVLDYYRNPVRQPVIKGIKGGMGKVYKSYVEKGMCDAAIFRTAFFNKKLKEKQRNNFKVLHMTQIMPNQGISVSKRLTQSQKDSLKTELTSGVAGIDSTKGIIKRFGGKAKSFIPAKSNEFDGYNMLLEGVIFGW